MDLKVSRAFLMSPSSASLMLRMLFREVMYPRGSMTVCPLTLSDMRSSFIVKS